MSTTAYIVTAWVATFGAIGAYAGVIIARGRRLSRELPEDRRRWM